MEHVDLNNQDKINQILLSLQSIYLSNEISLIFLEIPLGQ